MEVIAEIRNSLRLSLSARRAWIEIDAIAVQAANSSVALRKESVDRNGGAFARPLAA